MAPLVKVGDYEVERELGRGGMATVYLARRRGPQGFSKRVALKVIRSELAGSGSFRAMFVDEAKIAQSLNHGNIVQLYELGEVEDLYFIAMEHVRGPNLLEVLRCQPGGLLPMAPALYITRCLCRALQYAHDKRGDHGEALGIIHRDVSPQNVLLTDDGQVKLADFGIARALDRQSGDTLPGMVKGKAGFLSPEQAAGDAVDQRSDIFALGIVTYLMLTGTNPLAAEDLQATLHKTLLANIPPLSATNPTLDERLDPLIGRAVAAEPRDRYQSAAAFLEALERLRFADNDTTDASDLARLLEDCGAVDPPAPRRSLDHALEQVLSEGSGSFAGADTEVATAAATPAGAAHASAVPATAVEAAPPQRRGSSPLLVGTLGMLLLVGITGAALVLSTRSAPKPSPATMTTRRDGGSIARRDVHSDQRVVAQQQSDLSAPRDARPDRVSAAIRPRRAAGELRVNLMPWARVTVDGRLVGDTPQRLKLPAGRHEVLLHNPSLKLRRKLTVRIKPNQIARIEKW